MPGLAAPAGPSWTTCSLRLAGHYLLSSASPRGRLPPSPGIDRLSGLVAFDTSARTLIAIQGLAPWRSCGHAAWTWLDPLHAFAGGTASVRATISQPATGGPGSGSLDAAQAIRLAGIDRPRAAVRPAAMALALGRADSSRHACRATLTRPPRSSRPTSAGSSGGRSRISSDPTRCASRRPRAFVVRSSGSR